MKRELNKAQEKLSRLEKEQQAYKREIARLEQQMATVRSEKEAPKGKMQQSSAGEGNSGEALKRWRDEVTQVLPAVQCFMALP